MAMTTMKVRAICGNMDGRASGTFRGCADAAEPMGRVRAIVSVATVLEAMLVGETDGDFRVGGQEKHLRALVWKVYASSCEWWRQPDW